MKQHIILFSLISFLLAFIQCDSDSICDTNLGIDWEKIDCDNTEVLYKIVKQVDFSSCIDEKLVTCIIDSRDAELFKLLNDSLSDEIKKKTFSNYSLLLSSIYKGNVYAFEQLIPYNEKYIHTPKYKEYLIEHLIQYCGTVDALKDNNFSPISTYDPKVGIYLLEEYFKHDSINSVTIQEKLKIPLLFSALNSLEATKYLIGKGGDVNSMIPSPDTIQEDFYYLERFILDLIHPPVDFGGQLSYYREQDIIDRLGMMDLIISNGGVMKNKKSDDNPYLFILQKAIKANKLMLLKQIIPRYKHIYDDTSADLLLKFIKQSTDEGVQEYLYSELTDWRETP